MVLNGAISISETLTFPPGEFGDDSADAHGDPPGHLRTAMAAMDFKRWSHGEKIWGLDPVGYLENCSFIDDKHIYIFNIYIYIYDEFAIKNR
jgi:hypothetical protein